MREWLSALADIAALLMLVGGMLILLLLTVVLFWAGIWPLGLLYGLLFLGYCVSARDWM